MHMYFRGSREMEGAADPSYYAPLVQSIILDNVTYLRRFLDTRPNCIDADIPFLCFPPGCKEELMVLKRTPLMIAAMSNSPKVVEYLLGKANVFKASPSDRATVFLCAEYNECSPTIINMLRDALVRVVPPPMNFNETSRQASFLSSTASHGQSLLDRLEQNIRTSCYSTGALGQRPSSSYLQLNWEMNGIVQEWKEPNILASSYVSSAVEERPLSSNRRLHWNINHTRQGREAKVMANSSAPCPGFMDENVQNRGNKNHIIQRRQEPNIPTPSDAADPSGGRTSSSNDQVHQNMNGSMQTSQEPNIPTPSDAGDPSGGRTSSSNDQVHQNMNGSMQTSQEPNIPTPSDAGDPSGGRTTSSNDQVHQNMNGSMQTSQEPNIPTPSDAGDHSGGRTSSSNDQAHQNMNDSMQEVQESETVINPSTLENAADVAYDLLKDFPPLDRKLVQSARRKYKI
ncbi:hypothetical protein V6N13_015176 [Hibiscus sabdariffa]